MQKVSTLEECLQLEKGKSILKTKEQLSIVARLEDEVAAAESDRDGVQTANDFCHQSDIQI